MKKLLLLLIVTLNINAGYAQFGNLLKKAKEKVQTKVDQKVDQKMDNAAQKTVDDADDAISGKNKKGKTGDNNSKSNNAENADVKSSGAAPKSFKAYGKYDFVPGEKIIAVEDFQQDAQGDFPDKWNTNASGEIKVIDGNKSKWLALSKTGTFYPEFINSIPENSTIEFDLACSNNYSYYSGFFSCVIAKTTNAKQIFNSWKGFGAEGRDGIALNIHPQGPGGSRDEGMYGYRVWEGGEEIQKNDGNQYNLTNTKNIAHVAIWRQKSRIRLYVNEEKVIDIPKALNKSGYNKIVFFIDYGYENADEYLISNLKVAVGAPDTRNKLITEGKFVTHGILFDVNSDKIKPESYGALKDIANVLNENADVKVKILGHTDSDGDDKSNLELSKKRAGSVKASLTKDFGIAADRMQTDGKGESEPADSNSTTEGKANNRRVEFIKQ